MPLSYLFARRVWVHGAYGVVQLIDDGYSTPGPMEWNARKGGMLTQSAFLYKF